ncbi:PAS domain-containing protein [bacterium]|jgi:transcriptional regulator with PAS, ATPase and Fis domain|nr:PAS domain-containing protein [bacterium]
MTKKLFQLNYLTKLIILFFLCMTGIATSAYIFLSQLISDFNFNPALIIKLEKTFLGILAGSGVSCSIILFVIYIDNRWFTKTLNEMTKESLSDRNLLTSCVDLSEGKTQQEILTNVSQVLQLYLTFSQIKTENLSLWIHTHKEILSQVTDGIIIINNDKVVTHINHISEQILGLLPSEILGQIISRKISNPEFLQIVANTITDDVKTINHPIECKDNKCIKLSVIPIKNNQELRLRTLIILKESRKS